MDELMSLCDAYGVCLIEDAAESLGSTYKGRQSGTFGRFGIYSFNGNKIITTSGGGMLVSDDEAAIEKARFLASQARDAAVHYQHSELGYNYRLSNILAGVGISQLEVLEDRVRARREIFHRYREALETYPGIRMMPELEGTVSNRWLTALTLDNGVTPEEAVACLAEQNIEARPLWKPLHTQPLFSSSVFYPHSDHERVSENLFSRGICLPSGSDLSCEEQQRVIDALAQLFETKGRKHGQPPCYEPIKRDADGSAQRYTAAIRHHICRLSPLRECRGFIDYERDGGVFKAHGIRVKQRWNPDNFPFGRRADKRRSSSVRVAEISGISIRTIRRSGKNRQILSGKQDRHPAAIDLLSG